MTLHQLGKRGFVALRYVAVEQLPVRQLAEFGLAEEVANMLKKDVCRSGRHG
jgi:hypothetical protein